MNDVPRETTWQRAWMFSRDDPFLFATAILGFLPPGEPNPDGRHQLEAWQAKALQAIRDGHKRLSIRSGHGVGKSAFLSILTLWAILTHDDCKVPLVAGSQDQLRDTLMPEIAKWADRLPPEMREQVDVQAERVVMRSFPDQSFAVARTASKDNPQAMAGFHAGFLMFLVDEASSVHEQAYEVAQGALSTPGALFILTGNPSKASGYFHATHTTLRDRWWTLKVSSADVPRARGHIEDVIEGYGRESNVYRVRVAGEFPTSDDITVIPLEWVEAAVGREVAPMAVRPVWAVDVARFGSDRSTLCKRRGNVITEPVKIWKNLDTMQLSGRIVKEWDECSLDDRPHEIVVDVIGIGAGVVDRLNELGLPVRGINVAEAPSNDDQYMRLRDELWWRARQWFFARDCAIPDDPALISELTALTYDFTSAGKLIVESKKDAKKRGLRSPDIADAFVLSFAADDRQRRERDRHRRSNDRGHSAWAA